MASVFISHSSKDKDIARQLTADLKHMGHSVWLDEWQIKVGQCIATEIERGIEKADFVVLLLSPHAVQSHWVDREWKAAYWDEVDKNAITILPALLDQCEIPKLIQTKKYANFSKSYAVGFHELVAALDWHADARGLKTSYERSHLELPRLIRGSDEVILLTCLELKAKVGRLDGKAVAIKGAGVFTIWGSHGNYVRFALRDGAGSFPDCLVEGETTLEEVILGQSEGNFYGRVESRFFVVSEWEPGEPPEIP